MIRRTATAGAVVASLATMAALAPAASANWDHRGPAAPEGDGGAPQVIAEGLANPRGMTFGPDGRLYVAEAGTGGDGECLPNPEGGPANCLGDTGAITRINVRTGHKSTFIGGLPSLAPQEAGADGSPAGSAAIGPQDISFDGWTAYFTVGLGADPDVRATLGDDGKKLASLWSARWGELTQVADLGAYEKANDPDAGQPEAAVDTNPYSVDATRGEILVTDAGGNDLLRVSRDGDVETAAVFAPFETTDAPPFLELPPGTKIPYQPVPTGITRYDDGTVYVGQLTGFPFPAGAANVFRIEDGAPVIDDRLTGFTNVVDVAFDRWDNLYVLQLTTTGLLGTPPNPGKLIRVSSDGTKTELAAGKLQTPLGLAIRGHNAYVADKGITPDGRIVRIPLW